MRRQIRRHSSHRSTSSSSRRRLGHLWSRLLHSRSRSRGHAALLDSTGPTQIILGLHSYQTVREQGGAGEAGPGAGLQNEAEEVDGQSSCRSPSADLQPCTPESPASPLSFHSAESLDEDELSPISRGSAPSEPSSPQPASAPPCPLRPSRKMVLELAVNLKGVSLRHYSPLGPLSPISPSVFTSRPQMHSPQIHPEGSEVVSPAEPRSSVKVEEGVCHFTANVQSREINSKDEKRREGNS